MEQIREIYVKSKFMKQMQNGYPLILKEAVDIPEVPIVEGTIVQLLDAQGGYIATGYYGEQNKGIGWVLSRKQKEAIDVRFFKK